MVVPRWFVVIGLSQVSSMMMMMMMMMKLIVESEEREGLRRMVVCHVVYVLDLDCQNLTLVPSYVVSLGFYLCFVLKTSTGVDLGHILPMSSD